VTITTNDLSGSGERVVNLQNVTVHRGGKNILAKINWQVQAHERWVIMGPNGAGKTTLMQICTGFLHPTSGTAEILGQQLGRTDVRELRTRIGLSSAALNNYLPLDETVFNTVLTAAYAVTGRWRERYDEIDYARTRQLLNDWGLSGFEERLIGTLSEGERKRTHIARALMSDPEILILDEPAAGLDVAGREDLVSRLANLAGNPESPCLILVTHHVEEIPPNFSHALLLSDGQVSAMGNVHDVIRSEPMSIAFKTPLDVEFGDDRWYARGRTPSRGRRARSNM
jgi:iron complex transport system ATP-binding protein